MRTTKSPRRRVLARAASLVVAATASLVFAASAASASGHNVGFGVIARDISGAPTGAVALIGGGTFDNAAWSANAAGAFRCTASVNQGPLSGCLAGDGFRWSSDGLLPSTSFKCTGAASEALKTAATDDDTVVLRADFFRVRDGIHPSLTANVIVSASDIAPDVNGTQNVWIQGVGCAPALTQFGG